MNLEKIIELRNTSTHFITEEYEMVYIPLFQATVFNYVEKLLEYHGIDISKEIPSNFLTLSVNISTFDENEIRAKYPAPIADRLIGINAKLTPIIEESNSNFAIKVDHRYYLTKDKSDATALVAIDNRADANVKIIKDYRDMAETHKLTAGTIIDKLRNKIKKNNLPFKSHKGEPCDFNNYHFRLICDYYGIKTNKKFCYAYKVHTQPTYSYSIATLEFIYDEIKKDPENIMKNIKNSLDSKK